MSKIFTQIKHAQVVRDVKAIIARGREDFEMDTQGQVIETNWRVGKYLAGEIHLEKVPSLKNARIIRHLAREFNQPTPYFYAVIKFYKYYPEFPLNNSFLTWKHYQTLLTIEDDVLRDRYERMAVEEKMSSEDLHEVIAGNKVLSLEHEGAAKS